MEVVSEDGSQIQIKLGQTRELGRADGLNGADKTISRHHLSFFIAGESKNQEIRLQFEVLGRNPIYVHKDNEVKIYRRLERGEMGNGDMFCVSAKNPVWYTVRKFENGGEDVRRNDLESELAGSLESCSEFRGVEHLDPEGVDISDVDPVKEFGFVVEGHEFDTYAKKMIKDIRNWDWFLEEEGKDSEDDDNDGKKGKAHRRRKRKKATENEDEEWTGESEDEKVLIEKSGKAQKPKYMTRSKDHGNMSRDMSKRKSPTRTRNRVVDDEDEEDEVEDDETLGGFIVNDENLPGEEEIGEEKEDEEEEFVDEDEDE